MLLVGPRDEFNRSLAGLIGADLVPIERRVFPDGEIGSRIVVSSQDELSGREVILSLRMRAGSCSPNDYLVELLLTSMNLKRNLGVSRLVAVIPYFPYARQDSIFRPGEPLSARHAAELIEGAGVDAVVSVTVHLHRLGSISEIFERIEAVEVSGVKSLAREVSGFRPEVVVGPDTESISWARELAEEISVDSYTAFKKERDVVTGEIKTEVRELDVAGRTVVVVDDIVSTGGTMANAVSALKDMGAERVISAFVHPVLAPGSVDRIIGAGADALIATDTLEWPGSRASVVPEVAEGLRRLIG